MRRAGHGVFGNSERRGKEAGDEIDPSSPGALAITAGQSNLAARRNREQALQRRTLWHRAP